MIFAITAPMAALASSRHVKAESQTSSSQETSPERSGEVADWVEAAAEGDMQAFRCLYDEFLPYVRHNIARLVGPRPEVDDLIQDVFVQVHGSLGDFRQESSFKTWLYRVTRNVTIDHLRKRKKTVELAELQPLRANARTLSKIEARDQVKALYAVLDQVSVESREAFILFEVEELKLREIAELTDTSINTVAARVRRTRERLRTFLEASHAEESS
ncbi:RNA polymerase sigma factor [Persicimonas caeni]|uniref:RNA polymerase sigma factor n=1 Tax=Persicimonas caeni TaxID=2292766 RepID=A0A4Y6PMY9_PERCE|nr:RNA polymerase sigma factor [Persicimonas caeni]QED30897.1 RNA polymerase sigma factor [Persicimonas caeni]